MQKKGEGLCNYMEGYQDMFDLDAKNNNNEYRTNEDLEDLAELISEMKTLETHLTTVMNKVDAFERELIHVLVNKGGKIIEQEKHER